ncbi:hypothetical protein CDV55_102061 [Aspergillus turcosus]|nr:hypothetical protein CDV55_102061 [Aspergillus turcosus]
MAVLPPYKLAHVVFQTTRYDEMITWYERILNAKANFRNDVVCFMSYDDEHHRIAIVRQPGLTEHVRSAAGLHHVAFTYKSLNDLLTAYSERKKLGIEPIWCVNHGTTTSIYYRDPDGNNVETQVDNFDTDEETTAFMESPLFEENPIGTDFDPEELLARLQAGEDEAILKKRVEIGRRSRPPVHI